MSKRFQRADAKICVAIKFDEVGDHTLKFAVQYCMRTGAKLHIVHVCEPSITEVLDLHYDSTFPIAVYDYVKAANESRQKSAALKMREILETIPAVISVTHVILEAESPSSELIHTEAEDNDCSMIIVGTLSDSHRFIPNSLSCALSLMAHSNLPVMVVKTSHKVDFTAKTLRIVIADDLQSKSSDAIKSGCELAFTLSNTDIYHVHINAVTTETLAKKFKKTQTYIQSKLEVLLDSKDIVCLIQKHLEEKLDARARDMNFPLCISGCTYNKRVLSAASVFDGLKSFVDEQKSDVVVFGRHQSIHRSPFHIGKIPLYAMLELSCPIILFPPGETVSPHGGSED